MGYLQLNNLPFAFFVEAVMLSSSTYTTVRPDAASDARKLWQHLPKYKGVRASCHDEQFFWHHPGSVFCDLWENQRCYCRLYLGIKIYRQSIRIIFGAHVAQSLLWNTLTILHAPGLSFAELEFQFSIPLQSFTNQTLSEGQLMCCCESPTERISSYCLSSGIIP